MVIEWVQRVRFDSQLYIREVSAERNADLILIVKAFLNREEPSASDNREFEGVPIQEWGQAWQPWRLEFKSAVENAWNNRLWLTPSQYWGAPDTVERGLIPNIKCGIQLQLMDSAWGAHATFNCVRTVNSFFRSHMGHFTTANYLVNRMGAFRDTDVRQQIGGQVVVAHEIGHLIGLNHVNGASNNRQAYGTTPGQQADIMGMGMRINGWHAGPWRQRLVEHLLPQYQSVNWQAVTERPLPRGACPVDRPQPVPSPPLQRYRR